MNKFSSIDLSDLRTSEMLTALLIVSLSVGSITQPLVAEEATAFLKKCCCECRDQDVSKGDFTLDRLIINLTSPESQIQWMKMFDRVRRQEMLPSDKKKQPNNAARAQFLTQLEKPLIAAYDQHRKSEGRVTLWRLSAQQVKET